MQEGKDSPLLMIVMKKMVGLDPAVVYYAFQLVNYVDSGQFYVATITNIIIIITIIITTPPTQLNIP